MSPTYQIGDEVIVKSLKKKGSISSTAQKKGKVQVTIGCLNFWVEPEDLKPFKSQARPVVSKKKTYQKDGHAEVDLHGLTVEQAIDELKNALNSAVVSGYSELQVIHGKGTGRVKSAVLAYLAKSPFKKGVREKLGNAGTTIVEL